MQPDTTFVYSSVHSATCFGLIGHHSDDQEYNSMYTFLVNNQLDALILINYLFISFLLTTCFELLELIIRRD
jgi:hypothetical protein